jgi:hypothetical protein
MLVAVNERFPLSVTDAMLMELLSKRTVTDRVALIAGKVAPAAVFQSPRSLKVPDPEVKDTEF